MKFEKLYARIFFAKPKNPKKRQRELGLAAKKRYAGLLVYKDGKPIWKLDIVGFPVKRSDTAKITIECQKAVLGAVVFTKNPYSNVYKIVRRYYKRVKSSRLHPNEVGIPKGFGSSLRTYNKAQRTYRWYAAHWANDHLGTNYGKASKPKGVALKYLPPPWNQYPLHRKHKYNWMAFDDEYPLREDFFHVIDWDFMANATIIEPMKSIYESVDIKTSQIKSGTKKTDIKRGF
jgi:DNA polymerase elongation subunit (family B)